MHRLFTAAALAATVLIAACGSSSTTTDTGNTAIAVKHVDGVGDVLVDASGQALYTPVQEANGKIRCVGQCLSFWHPLAAGANPTAAAGTGKVAVITRPDQTKQVTVDGKPAYSFSEDAPGKVTGDGFKDAFGGQKFTWHVLLAGGGTSAGSSSGGGTGDASSSGGGYSY
jgi:predicted lipoprotein with Yx(FWY)xxD motif